MFGKKSKPTIDLQDDKERQALELAALEASLEFLKRPAKPAEDENQEGGEGAVKEVTAADRARAQKFGRRMDYKTAVVKRGSESEAAEAATNEDESKAKTAPAEEKTEEPAAAEKESAAAAEAESRDEKPVKETSETEKEDDVKLTEEEVKTVTESAPEPVKAEVKEDAAAEAEEDKAAGEEQEEEKKSGLIIAEAPVPDTGEEAEAETVFIENPLPTPKKHVPREMDFDLEPDADQMHFDVVDMKGKDYFDID